MAQMRIFVSHSSHDNAWSRPLADALKAVGYDVWYDETGLQGGAAWVASIQHEVETRDVFLLVLTPEAWESKWVQDELQLAIATRRRILPVLLRNTQVSGFLHTIQWISVIGQEPQAGARAAIMAIEAPPAPGRNAASQATNETLGDLIVLCRSLAAENRYTEALSACGRALDLDPSNLDALRIKAAVLFDVSEFERSVATWIQVLAQVPNDQGAWTECGNALEWISDTHQMLQAYWRLRSEHPSENVAPIEKLLSGLNRLGAEDKALGPLLQLNDPLILYAVLFRHTHTIARFDLIKHVGERYIGRQPDTVTVDDLPLLNLYLGYLGELHDRSEAISMHKLVIHVFENTYGYPPPPLQRAFSREILSAYCYSLTKIQGLAWPNFPAEFRGYSERADYINNHIYQLL